MNKKDGLTIIGPNFIESTLVKLKLKNLPGIGNSTESKLNKSGINSVQELYNTSEEELYKAWGSIVGRRYWYLLRGVDLPQAEVKKTSVSQSRVLIDNEKSISKARKVAMQLVQKAAYRLREKHLYAARVILQVEANLTKWPHKQSFKKSIKTAPTNDSTSLSKHILKCWDQVLSDRKIISIKKIGLILTDLAPDSGQLCLMDLDNQQKRRSISKAIDDLNNKYGTNTVSLGLVDLKKSAHEAIAFGHIPKETKG
jgi:DNA polymerase-4